MKRLTALSMLGALLLVAASAPQAPAELKTTEFGKGPTVVLVHSLGGKRMSWIPIARKLLGDHHVVMVDLPGHGDSPAPNPFSLGACGEELAATLAQHDPSTTVVVGHGVGGLVALQAFNKHPKAAAGLVLIEAACKATMEIPDQQQEAFMQQIDANYGQFIDMLYSSLARDSAQGVQLRSEAMRVESRVMKQYMRSLLRAEACSVPKKTGIPMLFVVSDRRMPDGKEWTEVAADFGYDPATMPHERVADSGSMIPLDQPDALAAIISTFTAEVVKKK